MLDPEDASTEEDAIEVALASQVEEYPEFKWEVDSVVLVNMDDYRDL